MSGPSIPSNRDVAELLRSIPEMQELLEHLAMRMLRLEQEIADLKARIGGSGP